MPKSRNRKKKKTGRVDLSGKPYSKKIEQEVRRKITMRHMLISQACESLKAEEVKDIIDREPFGGVLTYIETTLDENQVPVGGDTKELKLGGSTDRGRLERVYNQKVSQEEKAKDNIKD